MATPIGPVGDQNDCDLRCLIDRLSGRRPLISPFDAIPPPGSVSPQRNGPPPGPQSTTTPAPDSSYVSILLPVFLVIGVVILVLIIFLLHRFISILIKKRFGSGRNNDSSESQSGSSRGGGTDFDDSPPSYLQMMGSLENSDMPPSYYEIVKGKVNLGFLPEDGTNNSGSTDAEAGSVQHQDSTNLPNQAITTSSHQTKESVKDEKADQKSKSTKKIISKEQQTTTKFDIEEEIDSLSVPTVFSSSPVMQPRSSSKRGSNIKMLKVVPHLAAKRFKSIGVPQETPVTTNNGNNESPDGSVL